jgi:DNA polymerase
LRRYLEQRREAGETELVLDRMSVEDVMRVLGAGTASDVSSPSQSPTDWRATLRALDQQSDRELQRVDRLEAPREALPPPQRPPESPANSPADRSASSVSKNPPVSPRGHQFSPDSEFTEGAEGVSPHAASGGTIPLEQVPAGIVVGGAGHELFAGPESEFSTLGELSVGVATCTKCPLYRTAKNPVPGEGSPHAGLVCVGEAPGAVEDDLGRPFVGPAGQLLDKILAAIKLSRNDVYICNVLKHRPPGNRNPMPGEVEACSPYLVRQIELIKPKVVVAFGTFAAQTLLETKLSISKLRGQLHRYYGIPLVVTYHPAALLRNPAWKRPTWEDVQLARRVLDRAPGA